MADTAGPPDLWTEFTRPATAARVRLLCLPSAGGGALAYRQWVEALGADGIDVWPVQLPGRESRFDESPYDDMARLVSALLAEFGPALREGPYALFGHSMGGAIALEFAYAARQCRLPGPVRLFISAGRPPNRPDPEAPWYDLPAPEFVERLRKYDRGSGLLDDPELLKIFLPKLRADVALLQQYDRRPGEPLDCPLTVMGGWDDAAVPPNLFQGWADYTRAGFEIRLVGGAHFYLESAREFVLDLIRRRLENSS
ncbi:alpha/beta fold hydrolase [Nonomuraea sp. NPDC050643]|uniref:thioesterase II family protein n=1 Tax=Nonomuraea sp. NPDC050643 TaxID=3155660 RepID=UPI0033D2AA75